jgi:hypothetical protein
MVVHRIAFSSGLFVQSDRVHNFMVQRKTESIAAELTDPHVQTESDFSKSLNNNY